VVHDGEAAAIIDPVLDYDAASARTSTVSADAVLAFARQRALRVEWILETHAHADHLSAAGHLHDASGAPVAIGRGIADVQAHFKTVFGLGDDFIPDGRQFDRLLDDGDELAFGSLRVRAIATPGHTRDGLTMSPAAPPSSATPCSRPISAPRAATSPAATRCSCTHPSAASWRCRKPRGCSCVTTIRPHRASPWWQ